MSENSLFARHEWISACRFEDLGEAEVLKEVSKRISSLRKSTQKTAVVVFDLDSTLYEVAPRTHYIIKEWVASGHPLDADIYQALLGLKHEEVGYSMQDTFRAVGLNTEDPRIEQAWLTLKDFWWDRFFSSEYLKHDVAYPGAVDFVNEVFGLGANVVYLTGRDEKKMGVGTVNNLRRDGFPLLPDRTRILMKQHSHLSDADYKRQAAQDILKTGHVVASFENEPQNVVVLFETFPEALHVFMHTVCSDKAAKPIDGIYKINGFKKSG